MDRSEFCVLPSVMLYVVGAAVWPRLAATQTPTAAPTQAVCSAKGYRVVALQWDAVLGRNWELRQDCAHPEWPARSVAVGSATPIGIVRINEVIKIVQPLLVHAGDRVRLWSQNDTVRIEMSGVVEQSARSGDRVMVQVTRQSDDAGLTVERIAGIVCGSGDVEIER